MRILSVLVIVLVTLWFGAAFGLVFLAEPQFAKPVGSLPKPASQPLDAGESDSFQMRDGIKLRARRFASDAPFTILFLHGVLGNSRECLEICRHLQAETKAETIALDLRGHGASEGTPGDIGYISQYEDDVADVIAILRQRKPGGQILLAGHSMGGGIVMRYAAAHKSPAADGYLLLAPHLGITSPTMRNEPATKPGGKVEAPVKLHLGRIVGLLMLNTCCIRFLNGEKTLFFNVPADAPIKAYSFRAMSSMAPDDHKVALTADAKPLLAMVGQNDEAFRADQYPAVVSLHQNGQTVIIPGETHDGIMCSSEAVRAAAEWIKKTVAGGQF